jgi:hypothetical protein
MLVRSAIYVGHRGTTLVEAVFLGLGPAVIAIVVQALIRVGVSRTCSSLLLGRRYRRCSGPDRGGVPTRTHQRSDCVNEICN